MLIDLVQCADDIPAYVRTMWENNKMNVLEANAKYMYQYGLDTGKSEAEADRTILQRYAKDADKMAEASAKDKGFTVNMVAGFCDLYRKAYAKAYRQYEQDNPLVCECCGQQLPPKEG